MIRDRPTSGFPVLKATLAVLGVFLMGIVVLGSRDRPVVYDGHKTVATPAPQAATVIPTFPGCTGYACIAFADTNTALGISADGLPNPDGNRNTNCRAKPIKIIFVTNTNDTGTGSFRDAITNQVSNSNFNFILFKTGGTVRSAAGQPRMEASCVYVAGQTAPGGGFQVMRHIYGGSNQGLFRIDSGDVVIRYIKFRMNSSDGADAGGQNLNTTTSDRFLLDHVSTCCSDDKEVGLVGFTPTSVMDDISFRYSLFFWGISNSKPLGSSSGVASYSGGNTEDSPPTGGHDWYRNLSGGSGSRSPNMDGAHWNFIFANNITYGWTSRMGRIEMDSTTATDPLCPNGRCWNFGSTRTAMLYARNYMKRSMDENAGGAAGCAAGTLGPCFTAHSVDTNNRSGLMITYAVGNTNTNFKWLIGGVPDTSLATNRLFFRMQRQNWAVMADSTFRSSDPIHKHPRFPIDYISWTSAMTLDSVLEQAGATHKLDDVACDGTMVWNRDWLDSAFVQSVRDSIRIADLSASQCPTCFVGDTIAGAWARWWATTRAGSVDTVFHGLPLLAAGTPCPDADNDGMPTAYENAHTSISSGTFDAEDDSDGDGWWAIEEYLNGSNPDVFTNPDGSETGGPSAPVPTFGNNRWVYQDTLILDTIVSGGGATITVFVRPDTILFPYTGVPYAVVLKDVLTAAEGDTILILSDDSIVGAVSVQLDTLETDSLVVDWAPRCVDRGICVDSLRNRNVP